MKRKIMDISYERIVERLKIWENKNSEILEKLSKSKHHESNMVLMQEYLIIYGKISELRYLLGY